MTRPKKHAGGRPLTGPEPIDSQIAVKITGGQRDALDARAEADGVTVAAVVRAAIEAYVGR